MEFLFIFTLWWLELHTIKAMVDFQSSFEGWLDEATLFPAEHNDYINFDALLDSQKDNNIEISLDQWTAKNFDALLGSQKDNNVGLSIDQCTGLEWLDENVKLNVNDDQNSFTCLPNEEALFEECIKLCPELLFQYDSETKNLPTSDGIKQDLETKPNCSIPSSVASNDIPSSPPSYEPISAASSPESHVSDVPVDSTWYDLCLSPESASDSSRSDTPSLVSVTVCQDAEVGSDPPVPMTIEEVASAIREGKFAGKEGKIPKVTLKNTFHPYSKTKSGSKRKRTSDPAERKKVQNKEAAARYRMKKRSEEKELLDEVSNLEEEQKVLQAKHDDILSEIKYLKSLMCEMLQKKGLM